MMHPIRGDCKSKQRTNCRLATGAPDVGVPNRHNGRHGERRMGWVGHPGFAPSSARPGVRTMAYAALVTGVWSGLVCLGLYGIARLFGVPMEVETAGSMQTVPWFAVLLLPLLAAEIGAVASLIVRGRAPPDASSSGAEP